MIEGIGSNIGIIDDLRSKGPNAYLLCSRKDDKIVYTNELPDFVGQCDTLKHNSDIESYKNKKIKIYPNPSKAELTIEYTGERSNNFTIEMYNALGKLELVRNVKYLDKIKINTNKIPTGIYFIILKNEAGIVYSQKWVRY